MKKIKLTKIPSIFKNVNLPYEVMIASNIPAKEGTFVVVEAINTEGKKDDLDFSTGRLGKLVKADIIPAVLGYRKATVEFAGYIPTSINQGDELYLLCESGLIGAISGIYKAWGQPVKVKLLGSIVDEAGKVQNLGQFALPKQKPRQTKIPMISLIGTRMDCGKTTMAGKVIANLNQAGYKVAACKATGVAFSQDLYKFRESGANPVVDFVDMGLASTCNSQKNEVIFCCINLVNYLKHHKPDVIVVEFGDSLIGEYHVADLLKEEEIKEQISCVVLAAYDLTGIFGARQILQSIGLTIDLVTGPVVNSQIGVELVKKYFDLEAESNQQDIPKTMSLVRKFL